MKPLPGTAGDEAEAIAFRRVAAAALLSGAAALAYEIGWFRLLALVLGSSSDAFTLMLATFIGGLAAGSLWATGRVDRWTRPARTLFRLQTLLGLLVLATLPAVGLLPSLSLRLRAVALGSFPTYQALQVFLCAVLLAGPTFLLGVSFPLLSRLAATAPAAAGSRSGIGSRVGGILAWTTSGNIVGALLGGLAGVPYVGTRWTVTLASAASLAAGQVASPGPPAGRVRRLGLVLAAGVLLVALFPGWDVVLLTSAPFRVHDLSPAGLEELDQTRRRREILFLREDASATVSVEDREDNRILRVNGKPDASVALPDMSTQRLLGHYPMLFHPEPRRVMIIGLGSGVTAGAVLRHPVESVTVAEISSGVVEASRLFEEANHAYWHDPRLRLRVEDARHVLLAEPEAYDVVISEPSNLWMAGVASLYTREFYRLVDRRLRPGGIFVQWVHAYEMTGADLRLILRTFLSVFPHVTVFRSVPGDLEILGSDGPFQWDFDRMARRMAWDGVRADLEEVGIRDLYTLLTNQEIPGEDVAPFAGDGPVHVDDWPILERRALRALFENSGARLPEASLRIGNPRTLLRRYLVGRRPTARERYHFAAYSVGVRVRNNVVLTALEEAVREDPTLRPALRLLAELLADRERFREAARRMRQATELEPSDPEDFRLFSLYALEAAKRRVGFSLPLDVSESLRAMERCVALAPERADYRRQYAALLADSGQETEARRQLALAGGPQEPGAGAPGDPGGSP